MLLYLTSNKNMGIFDFLADENGMIIKKLSGTFQLKQFFIQDLRSLNHYAHIAIDLEALKDVEEEVIEAVQAFKSMYTSRVIFYVEKPNEYMTILTKLMDLGFYNIICSDDVDELKEQIKRATSHLEMNKKELMTLIRNDGDAEETSQEVYYFPNKNVRIAVTGVAHKVGTTTLAMNLCNYLAQLGAKVCYVEANSSNHLKIMTEYYPQMIKKEDDVICNGICFLELSSFSEEEYDFIIYDMGVTDIKVIGAIKNKCDLGIVCATGKPYEIGAYEKAMEMCKGVDVKSFFSFVSDNEQEKIKEAYGNVFFSEYTPSLFDGEKNETIWQQMLSKYMIKNKY